MSMSLAKRTSRLIGLPYRLGKTDCFSVVYGYVSEAVPLPDRWGGWTMGNYAARWRKNPALGKEVMVRLLDAHLPGVAPVRAFAGDVLLLAPRFSDAAWFLAIHGGGAVVVAASERRGVEALPLAHYKIRRAWSCRRRR